jgi:hypothetical protein
MELFDRPDRTIFLYTAQYIKRMEEVIHIVDGIHFTIHYPLLVDDLEGFYLFQKELQRWICKGRSFRLYIDSRISTPISITPAVWSRVEIKPWELEPPLPKGEKLFILNEE